MIKTKSKIQQYDQNGRQKIKRLLYLMLKGNAIWPHRKLELYDLIYFKFSKIPNGRQNIKMASKIKMAGISGTMHLRVKRTEMWPHMVTRLQKYIPKSAKIGIERQTFKWSPKISMACIADTVPLRLKNTEIWHKNYGHSNIYRKPF